MSRRRPPKGFASRPLEITQIPPGAEWWRLYGSRHSNPLGFGYDPSRFSDPKTTLDPPERYGVVYLGSTVKVCFTETILRDHAVGRLGTFPIDWADIEDRVSAKLRVVQVLNLVDLRGGGLVRMGIPTDVARASSQKLARTWSRAIWSHESLPDGIIYDSRLTGGTNIAIFDKALTKMRVVTKMPLIDCESDLAAIIQDFDLAIV